MSELALATGFQVVEQYYSKNGEREEVKEGDNLISILKKAL